MPSTHPMTILVLGPMARVRDDQLVRDPRTVDLVKLVADIVGDAAVVEGPDDNPSANIIPGILRKMERADLVVLDLTRSSDGVMYELGVVHALGLPCICLTGDEKRPFYVGTQLCITRFDLSPRFDDQRPSHLDLRAPLMRFLAGEPARPEDDTLAADFAANPLTEFFGGLPIVDISAPAGLAAGYWRNAVRRFVCHGGYLEEPDRVVALKIGDGLVARTLAFGDFVAVKPPSGLSAVADADFRALRAALASAGLSLVSGHIRQANPQDMRDFGVNVLARSAADGSIEIVDPGVVIDIPTTLYALQYSPRILRIDQLGRLAADRGPIDRLKLRRYDHMLDRFSAILDFYLRNGDNPAHINKVHVVDLSRLVELLNRLAARK